MTEKIITRFIIEIGGKPVENVDKALKLVLDKLNNKENKFKLIDSHIGNSELDEKTTLYYGFIEAEVKFKEVNDIFNFILDYTPTSVEVLEPEHIEINSSGLTDLLNNVSNMSLSFQQKIRELNAQVHFLNEKLKKE